MILSNGKQAEMKALDDSVLVREERSFFSRYKNSTQSTLSARNNTKFEQALENEIKAFNMWQVFVEEKNNRDIKGKRR